MGPKKTSVNLSEALFTGVQQRVLALLFGQPSRSFHVNELMRLAGSGKGGLQRELRRLTEPGLASVTHVGNQKRYQANQASPIFDELCAIVQKTFGLAEVLRAALQPVEDRIVLAFVYGSVARQTDTAHSDIDLLVVSDTLSYQDLLAALGESESRLGRKINPVIYTDADLARRRAADNSFVQRVLEQPKVFLIGGTDELGQLGQPGEDRKTEGGTAGAGGV